MSRRATIAAAGALTFVIASRAVGITRELTISLGFGLSHGTDLFYQLTFVPTYLLAYMVGPFATALISSVARMSERHHGYAGRYLRNVVKVGSAVGIVLLLGWGGAVALGASGNPGIGNVSFAALSCGFVAVLGFGVAELNARRRFSLAQGLLFFNNVAFVLILITLAALRVPDVTAALMFAFLLASILASITLILVLRQGGTGTILTANSEGSRSGQHLVGFKRGLALASIETAGYIVTQGIVLMTASAADPGTASAAALGQRICLSATTLIVGPLSSILMVKLGECERNRARFIVVSVCAVGATLTLIAGVITCGSGFLAEALVHRGKFSAENAILLASLLPVFALWLIPLGLNMLLQRLLFVAGRARTFTGITIGGYIIANLCRLGISLGGSFRTGIAVGAAIELMAIGVIIAVTLSAAGRKHLMEHSRAYKDSARP